jgi:hypothetical protein
VDWDERVEIDARINRAVNRRTREDHGAYDRDRPPREGDKAVLDGRIVDVMSLGLPDDELRRMFRDGEMAPYVEHAWEEGDP